MQLSPQPARCPNRKFIVFDRCDLVSVTGLCGFEAVEHAALEYCNVFDRRVVEGSVRVDNCTASGELPNVDRRLLTQLAAAYRSSPRDELTVSARTRNFPGLLIRTRKRCRNHRGTLTLFTTGKFVVLGAKSQQDIDGLVAATLELLHRYGWRGVDDDDGDLSPPPAAAGQRA